MMIGSLSNKFSGISNHQVMSIDKTIRHEDANTFFKMLHVKNNGSNKGAENEGVLGDHTNLIEMLNQILEVLEVNKQKVPGGDERSILNKQQPSKSQENINIPDSNHKVDENDNDSNADGNLNSAKIPGLIVKSGSGTAESAQKLLDIIENLYANDREFRAAMDAKLAKSKTLTFEVSSKLGERDGGKVGGRAKIGGNSITIADFVMDMDMKEAQVVNSEHPGTKEAIIAHEFAHSLGYKHGPKMDAAVKKLSDFS